MKNQAVSNGAQSPPTSVRRMGMMSDIFSMSKPAVNTSFGDVFSQEMNKVNLQQRPAQTEQARFDQQSRTQDTQSQPFNTEQANTFQKPAELPRSETSQAEKPAERPAQPEAQRKTEQSTQPDRTTIEAAAAAAQQQQQQQAPRPEVVRKEEQTGSAQGIAIQAGNSRKSAFVAAQLASLNAESRKADENLLRDVLKNAEAAFEQKDSKKTKSDSQQASKKVTSETAKGEQTQKGEPTKVNPEAKEKSQNDKPQFATALSEQAEKKDTSAVQARAAKTSETTSQDKVSLTAEQTAQAQTVAQKIAELGEAKKGSTKDSTSDNKSNLEVSSVKNNSAPKMTNELAQQPAAQQVDKTNTTAKTAETFGQARLAEARELTPVMQVVNSIETLIKDGQTTMRVQLHPENMGKIELQLVHTSNGISVVLIPDQAVTGKMLQSQLEDLRQALVGSGINLTDLNVGQQNQPQNQQHSGRRRGFGSAFFGTDDTDETIQQAPQFRSSISALDYRV